MQKMSEKEAKDIIYMWAMERASDGDVEACEAFDMAIAALEKQSMVNEILHECTELNRELDAYKEQEKQGLLLRLPCKVGDTVFRIFERRTKCTEKDQEFDEYYCQGCECLECDSRIEKYVHEMKAYGLDWIVANLSRFGKTIFLTKEEAESALEKMKGEEHE